MTLTNATTTTTTTYREGSGRSVQTEGSNPNSGVMCLPLCSGVSAGGGGGGDGGIASENVTVKVGRDEGDGVMGGISQQLSKKS